MMRWCIAAAVALLLASGIGNRASAATWQIGPYRVVLEHVAGAAGPSDRLRILLHDRVV
jgi:hypothetical protein